MPRLAYLADRVIVFDGQPGVDAHANKPESLLTGCNRFLKNLDVTFRRDPTNFRPRINKLNSQLDQEQKLGGNYVSCGPCASKRSDSDIYHSSSSRKIAREKGIYKRRGRKNGRKNRHRRVPRWSSRGVLGVQKRNGKRQNGGGPHELSGAEEEGGEDSEDPEDVARRRQSIPCYTWSCRSLKLILGGYFPLR